VATLLPRKVRLALFDERRRPFRVVVGGDRQPLGRSLALKCLLEGRGHPTVDEAFGLRECDSRPRRDGLDEVLDALLEGIALEQPREDAQFASPVGVE